MIAGSGPAAPPPPMVWSPGKPMISVSIPCYGASSKQSPTEELRREDSSLTGFLMGALLERVSKLRIFTKDTDICKMTRTHQMTTTVLPTM